MAQFASSIGISNDASTVYFAADERGSDTVYAHSSEGQEPKVTMQMTDNRCDLRLYIRILHDVVASSYSL